MSFAWPHILWFLLAPSGLLAWELTRRRRAGAAIAHPKILRAEAGAHDLSLSTRPPSPASQRRARPWLMGGLVFAIIALARPQWGRLEEPVFDQSREILLAIDLSRSMLTPDVRPSRLDRAKLLIQSLLEKLAGERVGLVVFSGTAFLQSPLSADYEILREFLPSLGPDFLPEGGTNYGALLDTSMQAFGNSTAADRFVIVLSDGEATDENWKTRIDDLKSKGIRVLGLGVGTAAGAMIPDGAGGFVKDERGAVVLSKLESGTLQQLAQDTGGAYRDASMWIDLAGLLKSTVEAGHKGRFVEKNTVRRVERFQWPLALGLWCVLISLCYEFPIRPRPRSITLRLPQNVSANAAPEKSPAAAAALAVLIAFSILLSAPTALAAATIAAPLPPASDSLPLSRIVGRLSERNTRTARDWADLGRETVMWGSRLQSDQHPVPEGPVRDALGAVDLGSKLDPTTTDWKKLREELEALLKPNEDEQPQKQDQNQQQDKDQKKQDPQNKDQSQDQNQSNSRQSPPQDQKNSDAQQKSQPFDQNVKPPEDQPPKPGESAFGDMSKKEEPPPPPGDTQKVGGNPENKEQPKTPPDQALTLPLQKLDQLRNQDSPARLFELMEGDRKATPKKPGKDW